MSPTYIDISYFRSNLSKIAEDVFLRGKTYVVKRSDIPLMEVRKAEGEEEVFVDPWDEALGGWKKYMTENEADRLIKKIYRLRKDGSSKKKTLWEQP